MLIHENGRLSIEHSLAGGLHDMLNLLQSFFSCQKRQTKALIDFTFKKALHYIVTQQRNFYGYLVLKVDHQLAILAAIAACDSGCQEVEYTIQTLLTFLKKAFFQRKWKNHRKLNRKQGIQRIATVNIITTSTFLVIIQISE